jgi:hypothetical protein
MTALAFIRVATVAVLWVDNVMEAELSGSVEAELTIVVEDSTRR